MPLIQICLPAIRCLAFFTALLGGIYPLGLTLISQFVMPKQANGSLVFQNNETRGSFLLGQKFSQRKYFSTRPSSSDYSSTPSGASNDGPTSAKLLAAIRVRKENLQKENPGASEFPVDLWTTSGSGLDPHLSPASVRLQIQSVVKARGWSPIEADRLSKLVDNAVEFPQFGFMGQPRINVVLLNLQVDQMER